MGTPYKRNDREYRLFEAALEIKSPWFIQEVRMDDTRSRLDIILNFERGALFTCNTCKKEFTAHDTRIREWRHLDFFQYETHLYAPLPRTSCQNAE